MNTPHAGPEPQDAAPAKSCRGLRTWICVALVWTLGPLLILGAAETGLRLAGYGRTTKPFLMHTIDGKKYAAVNMSFFVQFMPIMTDSLGTMPYDVVIPVEKPPNTCRVAVLGSSAALGYLHPEYSPWRMLNVVLRAKYPGVNFEVYCLGWNGMNSHVMRYMAAASKFLNFDMYFVYMGNNEVKGTLALMYDMTKRYPTHQIVRMYAFLSDLRIIQAMSRGIAAVAGRSKNLRSWEANAGYMSMDDPRLKRVFRNYRENLEGICKSASDAGAATVLCTVATNLRTSRPFGPMNRAELTGPESQQWDQYYRDGIAREEAGAYPEALGQYRQALAIDDYNADLLFRLGTCYWATGEYDKAREFFVRAHEQDFALVSANAHINDAVRDTAQAHAGDRVYLADAAQQLAERSPHGVPGDEFFEDHVHLTFEGCYELVRAAYGQIAQSLPEWVRGNLRGEAQAPPIEECKERMAVSPFDLLGLLDTPIAMCDHATPKRSADYYRQLQAEYEKELQGKDRNQVTADACRRAIALDGGDYYIRRKFVQALGMAGEEAEKEARILVQQYPYQWGSWSLLADTLEMRGKREEALDTFARRFTGFPAYAETYFVWGNKLAERGRLKEALAAYRQASSMKRLNACARIGEANTLARLGDVNGAVNVYCDIIMDDPGRPDYCQFLDELLKAHKSAEERAVLWRGLSDKLPDAALPMVFLGTTLEDTGRMDEAVAALRAALVRDPNSVQAKEALDRCLAGKGEPGSTVPKSQ